MCRHYRREFNLFVEFTYVVEFLGFCLLVQREWRCRSPAVFGAVYYFSSAWYSSERKVYQCLQFFIWHYSTVLKLSSVSWGMMLFRYVTLYHCFIYWCCAHSFLEENGSLEADETLSLDGKLEIISECWVEPVNGTVMNCSSELSHFSDKIYCHIPDVVSCRSGHRFIYIL